MRKLIPIGMLTLAMASPASAEFQYHVVRTVDAFTDQQTCRTVFGTDFSRSFAEGMLHWYGISYFFAERVGNEVVAGITNDRDLPVAGDIQIRVDDNPVITITPADTPEDLLPPSAVPVPSIGLPEADKQLAETMRIARAQMTPFRVAAGDKAKMLLSEIINGRRAIWRSITMVAAANQGPTEIRIDGLKEAIEECGIDLTLTNESPNQTPSTNLQPYQQPTK